MFLEIMYIVILCEGHKGEPGGKEMVREGSQYHVTMCIVLGDWT